MESGTLTETIIGAGIRHLRFGDYAFFSDAGPNSKTSALGINAPIGEFTSISTYFAFFASATLSLGTRHQWIASIFDRPRGIGSTPSRVATSR